MSVIRAWERRYQAIEPFRTESNRRLYSEKDIYRLGLLKRVSDSGINIRDVAGMSNAELRQISSETEGLVSADHRPDFSGELARVPDIHLEDCLNAARYFDQMKLEYALVNAATVFSQSELLDQVIIPLTVQVGDLWEKEQFSIGNEHLVSAVLRTFLENCRAKYKPFQGSTRIIITTPTKHKHELGAQMAATTAAAAGWEVIYLGPDLPGNEIAQAARETRAHVVAVSLVYPPGNPDVEGELRVLRELLPDRIRIFAGGAGCPTYLETLQKIHAQIFSTIAEFRQYLYRDSLA